MAAFEAAGDPDGLPARRRAVAAAEDLLQPDASAGAGSSRSTTRMHRRRAGEPVRRVAQATGRTAASGPSPRGSHCADYFDAARPGAAGPRDPGRPRRHVVPGAAGHAARGLADRGLRGGAVVRARSRRARTTCSPGSARRGGGRRARDAARDLAIAYDGTEGPAVNTPQHARSRRASGLPRLLPARDRAVAAHAQHEQADAPDVLPRGAGGRGQGEAGRGAGDAGRRAHRGPARGRHRRRPP